MKKIEEDDDICTDMTSIIRMPYYERNEFEEISWRREDYEYIGSAVCFGIAAIGRELHLEQQLFYHSSRTECLLLRTDYGDTIELPLIFAPFYGQLMRFASLAKIKYYAQQTAQILRKDLQKQAKRSLKKNGLKKIVQIRIDVYMNKNIFNQKNPQFANKIKQSDLIRNKMYKLKRDSKEYIQLSNELYILDTHLETEKIIRGFILFLFQKTQVKVLNRSFVKPPPKLNFMMRSYRKKTIGIITRNKRNQRRIQMKINKWKRIFTTLSTIHHCIRSKEDRQYYGNIPKKEKYFWREKLTDFLQKKEAIQQLKVQYRNNNYENEQKTMKKLHEERKKLMQEMGATGFDSSDEDSDNEDSKGLKEDEILMKRNQALMERFQKQNKHFRQHLDPEGFQSTLKSYQRQALQWMKYRQGKIPVQELFQKQYLQQIEEFQYERKLSPFWEEVELLNTEKFFINYLTGEFTRKFHSWKSIKGGILADQMGLGKTVMTLSLLADQQYEGLNLIVVPVSVILQWKQQVKKHCGSHVKVFEFHSNSKSRRKVDLTQYNIILITYSTLGHEYKAYSEKRQEDIKYLFNYRFKRVILDEAHNIKGTKTLQFSAVMNLESQYSWCLTGTLIQNSEQDLFAIFKFLRVEVFSEEYWWNQYIKNSGCTQAKLNVIQTVLRPIVLRRTKASTSYKGQAIIQLKQKKQIIIRPKFSKSQEAIYKKLQQGVRSFFRNNANSTKNYTHVFQIICKLRQFCCHPALIFGRDIGQIDEKDVQTTLSKFLESRVTGKKFRETAIQTLMESGTNCVICLQQPSSDKAVLTQCGHFFCQPCLKNALLKNHVCPLCRAPLGLDGYIKKDDLKTEIPEQIKYAKDSSKVTAILKVIKQIRQRNEKCVIFTQWIPIISILEQKLDERQIGYGTIKGDVPAKKRQSIIEYFRTDQDCFFLIVSIKAGGTGLNLAFANNVMICDPWWNPSHEDQAIGRVHRMGQQKDVNVYRFYMKDSIEQKIEKMHVTKRKIADQVMMQKGSLRDQKGGAQQLIRLLQ